MAEHYKVICTCSYMGSAKYREKDSPFSSYGIWEFQGFNCAKTPVERPVSMTMIDAIDEAKPFCPKCHQEINISMFIEDSNN